MKLKPVKPFGSVDRSPIPAWIPMERIKPFLEEYRGALAAGAVVTAVLLIFALLYLRHNHSVAERSSQIFREAMNIYNYKIPPPDGETTPTFATDEEKFSRALQAFQSLSETYPSADLAPVSLFYVGNCRFRLKQYTQALDSYDQFLTRYRKHTLVPYATLGKGDSLEQLARFQEAYTSYKQVMNTGGALSYEGALGTARCLLKLTETDRNRWAEAVDILNRLAAEPVGYSGKSSRALQKLLADLSPTKQPAAPRPGPASGGRRTPGGVAGAAPAPTGPPSAQPQSAVPPAPPVPAASVPH